MNANPQFRQKSHSNTAGIRSIQQIESTIQNLKEFHLRAVQKHDQAMRAEYRSFKSKYIKFSETHSKLLKTTEALGVQLNSANDQNDALKRVNGSTIRENQELMMRCNTLEQTITKLEKQTDVFRTSIASEHEQNEKLTNEIHILQTQHKQNETDRKEQERIIGELRDKVSRQEIEWTVLNDKFIKLNKESSERQQICETQIKLLVDKLNEIDGQKYEHLHKDIENLQKQSNKDALKNVNLQSEIDDHRSKMQQIESERDLAKSQVSSLLMRIDDIQNGQCSNDETTSSSHSKPQSILRKSVHFQVQ